MKIVIFVSILWCGAFYSQGNLQFNQVKIISNTDPSQTVPAGKVWKIESVFSEGGDTYPLDGNGSTQTYFSSCGIPSFYFKNYGLKLVVQKPLTSSRK